MLLYCCQCVVSPVNCTLCIMCYNSTLLDPLVERCFFLSHSDISVKMLTETNASTIHIPYNSPSTGIFQTNHSRVVIDGQYNSLKVLWLCLKAFTELQTVVVWACSTPIYWQIQTQTTTDRDTQRHMADGQTDRQADRQGGRQARQTEPKLYTVYGMKNECL